MKMNDRIANEKVITLFQHVTVSAAANSDSSEIDLMATRTASGAGIAYGMEDASESGLLIIDLTDTTTASVVTVTVDGGTTSGTLTDFCSLTAITKAATGTIYIAQIKDMPRYVKFNVAAATQECVVSMYMIATGLRRPVEQLATSELTVTYD